MVEIDYWTAIRNATFPIWPVIELKDAYDSGVSSGTITQVVSGTMPWEPNQTPINPTYNYGATFSDQSYDQLQDFIMNWNANASPASTNTPTPSSGTDIFSGINSTLGMLAIVVGLFYGGKLLNSVVK